MRTLTGRRSPSGVGAAPSALRQAEARLESNRVFLEHLDLIEELIGRLCARKRLDPDDADDFEGWAKMRLLENDCAILRGFRGDCGIRHFLAVVVANLLRDFRDRKWGRWRPSAAARKKGPEAVALETLTVRDGVPLGTAVQILRERGHEELGELEAARLLADLPMRTRRHVQGEEALRTVPSEDRPDAELRERENAESLGRLAGILEDAMAGLDPEERAIIRLRYWDGLSIADTARALGLPQKPLYRRIPRILDRIREAMVQTDFPVESTFEWLGLPASSPLP